MAETLALEAGERKEDRMLPYDVLRQVTYDHMTQLEEDARLERLARRTQRHGQRTRRAELRMHSRRWASAHLLRALRS